jgi:hypothetical protein
MVLMEERLNLKCILTDEEKLEYGRQQSLNFEKMKEVEGQKKQAVKQFDAEVAGCESAIASTSQKINNGYEYRYVKCEILYDWKGRIKRWVRSDTGEIAKEDMISDSEMVQQEDLNLNS